MSASELFLVSGGSGGIGAAVCDQLAMRGLIPVVGYCRNHETALAIAQRTNGISLELDMTSSASIEAAYTLLAESSSSLAGVILAGSPPPLLVPFGKTTIEEMTLQWQVNVAGPQLLLAGLVRNCFRKLKKGSVVGVLTSAMGTGLGSAAPNMAAYLIAKYGMAGMLAAAAADYPWLKVRSVSPGFTETPMLKAFDSRFLDLQRMKCAFQTPEEIAEMLVKSALGDSPN